MMIPAVKRAILCTMAVALAGGLSLASAGAREKVPATRDSEQVMKLLKEARSEAVKLQLEADKLESYKNSGLNRVSQARQLEVTKGYVNDLGKTLDKLEAQKAEASAWQQKTIEEMRPLLEQLAQRTTQAIEHVTDNPWQLRHPDYDEMLADKSNLAVQLADLLDDNIKYGEAKAELEEREAEVGPLH